MRATDLGGFAPGYNVVIAMRILGRPDAHALLFLVPVFNVYFFFKTVIELAQAFGKHTMTDFVLAAVFNVFYVLNLSLAWQEEYEGRFTAKPLASPLDCRRPDALTTSYKKAPSSGAFSFPNSWLIRGGPWLLQKLLQGHPGSFHPP